MARIENNVQIVKSKWSGRLYAVRADRHLAVMYKLYLEDYVASRFNGTIVKWGATVLKDYESEFIPCPMGNILYAYT